MDSWPFHQLAKAPGAASESDGEDAPEATSASGAAATPPVVGPVGFSGEVEFASAGIGAAVSASGGSGAGSWERTSAVAVNRYARVMTLSPGKEPSSRPYPVLRIPTADRKSTRLNSSHVKISYAVFCLKKK